MRCNAVHKGTARPLVQRALFPFNVSHFTFHFSHLPSHLSRLTKGDKVLIIGKVAGEIYSTINHDFYNSKKLLVVDKLTLAGKSSDDYLIAVDSVGAGVGETVLIVDEGNSARQVVDDPNAPIRSIIIGIIDEIHFG